MIYLKGFYAMGGNSDAIGNQTISAEFNFLADPEAAHVVLAKTPKPIVLVPWEICGFGLKIPLVIKVTQKITSKIPVLTNHI